MSEKTWFMRDLSPGYHDYSIKQYFKDPYSKKDTNLYANILLTKIYLEECCKYLVTDFDLVRLDSLVCSLSNSLIHYLAEQKEYEILKGLYEALAIFSANALLSDYNKRILKLEQLTLADFESEKDYLKCLVVINERLSLINKLMKHVIECFKQAESLKPKSNPLVQEIQSIYLKAYKEYKDKGLDD